MKHIFLISLCSLALPLLALELPSVFSDLMVLQQEKPVKVWGRSAVGSTVVVQFAGNTASAVTDNEGTWSLELDPMEASFEPREFIVTSGNTKKVFEDVLVGEVWLASGQSNMGWEVRKSADSDLLLLGTGDPALRLHRIGFQPSREFEFTSRLSWTEDTPQQVTYFSAVGYQFARDLRKTLKVPVGIIHSAVGGTPVIAWTRQTKISEVPELRVIEDGWEERLSNFDTIMASWESEYAAWRESKGITGKDYRKHSRQGAPRKPEGPDSPKRPASLANGMISPIAGFTIRGMIWYQGEADANASPETYDVRLNAMIDDWRTWWGDDSIPFGIVQLPDFMKPQPRPANSHWAKLRESQRQVAAKDPNTGLVVTLGLGEGDDIHPPKKAEVARRLARWALTDVYDKLDLRGGPEIESAVREGSSILLTFSQTGSGLRAHHQNELQEFTLSDSMEEPAKPWWATNFYSTKATIVSKDQVRLDIPSGKSPVRVRYAWQSNPAEANLINIERLPAGPFEITISTP